MPFAASPLRDMMPRGAKLWGGYSAALYPTELHRPKPMAGLEPETYAY